MTGMVSGSSMAAMGVTLFISMFLPLIVLLVFALKNKRQGVVGAWLIGAIGFLVPQMMIRLPLLSALSAGEGFASFISNHYLLYALFLGLTAAIFEAAGRFACAKILSNNLTYTRGIASGLGHGGIEAMILIGMTYVSNLLYAVMINSGAIEGMIEETAGMGVDVEAVYALVDTLVNTPGYLYLLAGYERILTMIAHVAMTLVVFYFMWKEETWKGIGICVAYHAVLDTMSGVISGLATPYLGSVISQNVSYVIIYIFLTAMVAAAVVMIFKIKAAWKTDLDKIASGSGKEY